jgi:hypothetical protein
VGAGDTRMQPAAGVEPDRGRDLPATRFVRAALLPQEWIRGGRLGGHAMAGADVDGRLDGAAQAFKRPEYSRSALALPFVRPPVDHRVVVRPIEEVVPPEHAFAHERRPLENAKGPAVVGIDVSLDSVQA